MRHIVQGDKILSLPQLSKKHLKNLKLPGFTEVVDQLPRPATKGIEQGASHDKLEWVQLPSKQIARVLGVSAGLATCEPQKVCPKQGLLTPLGVRPVVAKEETLTPSLALPLLPSKQIALVHADAGKGHYPLEQLGTQWPLTLERKAPIMLSSLTVGETRKIHVARRWSLPRTMAEGGIFRPFLSTHLSAAAQRKEQKEIAGISRHPLLTEKLAEIQFRIHHSGFWMGKHKCNKKRGDDPTCIECGKIEGIIHTFCDCQKINNFWKKVFKWWRGRTSEVIQATPKETLLGLRPDQDSLAFKELSLPFTYLRTQAINTIKNERMEFRRAQQIRCFETPLKNYKKVLTPFTLLRASGTSGTPP